MRAGAPRDTPQMPHGNPGGGEYFGHDRSTAEQMIREGLRASAVASTQPLSNDDERAAQIGQRLIDASNERIDQQRPREASTEPARSAEDFIRDGLRAGRAREAARGQGTQAESEAHMVMSAHMRRQLLIGGKGRYVASRVAAHPPMPMQRGSQRPRRRRGRSIAGPQRRAHGVGGDDRHGGR